MPPEAAGPHSPPYSFWFNADKALLPFVLIIIIPQLFVTAPLRRSPVCTGCYWLSPYLHYCYWQPLLADWGLNRICRAGCRRLCWRICFVSLAEEALFGCYSAGAFRYLPPYAALFIAAAVFGLAHIAGGPLLVVFAGLAGVIYGLAWMWSGRLWVTTGFHFALNLCHLLFYRPFKVA